MFLVLIVETSTSLIVAHRADITIQYNYITKHYITFYGEELRKCDTNEAHVKFEDA